MSDFDKEAEREKLREKLERDQEAREATEHMSELLLKGATMTNKHCDDCGDPVFRYQGQEFCPTCGQEVAMEGQSAQAPQQAQGSDDAPGAGTAEEASADVGEAAAGAEMPQGGTAGSADAQAGGAAAGAADRSVAPPTQGGGAPAQGGADLQAARAALVRKLARLAQQAEATDDVGRSRDLLAAAKEAAEALAAVDRARR